VKNLFSALICGLILLGLVFSCNKDNNNYELADYTLGMINSRTWHGYTYGYVKGDTVISGATMDWPKGFSRTIDTTFAIFKVNSFVLDAAGARIKFFTIDSALKRKEFDSTYAHSARSFLVYDWNKDTVYFEHHKVDDFNAAAGRAYEKHIYLRSDH